MDFGANVFGVGALADPGTLADVAHLAEDLGYHSVFVSDHVVMPRRVGSKYPYSSDGSFRYDPDQNWLDPMVALGYLAGRTTTIRLGTSVTVLPMRHPIVTAKQIATADHLSGGRVIFGVGVGWMEALDAAGRPRTDFVVSAFPTDRFTLDLVRQFAAHGVDHVMVPVFSFDADKVRQRLEQIATRVIEPYRRGA